MHPSREFARFVRSYPPCNKKKGKCLKTINLQEGFESYHETSLIYITLRCQLEHVQVGAVGNGTSRLRFREAWYRVGLR
jgi:hypothetical protein